MLRMTLPTRTASSQLCVLPSWKVWVPRSGFGGPRVSCWTSTPSSPLLAGWCGHITAHAQPWASLSSSGSWGQTNPPLRVVVGIQGDAPPRGQGREVLSVCPRSGCPGRGGSGCQPASTEHFSFASDQSPDAHLLTTCAILPGERGGQRASEASRLPGRESKVQTSSHPTPEPGLHSTRTLL